MMCVICKTGETHPGTATVTLEREGQRSSSNESRRGSVRIAEKSTLKKVSPLACYRQPKKQSVQEFR